MANEPATKESAEDYQAHLRDFTGFTHWFKYTAVAALVIALFVVWLIS
ncbi:MAG: aa3-type cytochrome c oxidase subunit IV [Sphingomicrobium sp.]